MFGTHYVDSDERDYHDAEFDMINTNYISTALPTSGNKPYTDRIMRIPIYKYKKKWDLEDTYDSNLNGETSSNIGIKATDLIDIIPTAVKENTSYIPNINVYLASFTTVGMTSVASYEYTLITKMSTNWKDIYENILNVQKIPYNLAKHILLIDPDGNKHQIEVANIDASVNISKGTQSITVYSVNELPTPTNTNPNDDWYVYGTLTDNYKSINYHEILNYLIMAFQE
jgi:hypothetical protein